MLVQSFIALSLASLSLAGALPLTKRTGKAHWWSGLESYDIYHARYMELDCAGRHASEFFDQCCHPRLKDTDLSTIPDQCLSKDEQCDDGEGDDTNVNSPSSAPVNAAPAPTMSPPAEKPAPTTTQTHSSTPKPEPTSKSSGGGGGLGNILVSGSGSGTFFYQKGNPGACGDVHKETDKVVALDSRLYGDTGKHSKYCGKSIRITNKANGKSVDAIVADACPTCNSKGSVDLSVGAFDAIAKEETGEIDIDWSIHQ